MNNEGKRFSAQDIKNNIDSHLEEIAKEFKGGFEILKKNPRSVTIFGSSRTQPSSPYYKKAQELAEKIVKEIGYAVVTGGGPGIMAAANLGAFEAQGNSIGFTIELPREQNTNPYVTIPLPFNYFFARKAMLTFSAEAFVFFPGGYGTFDEFFAVLTLIQNKKIPVVPVILIGKEFWTAATDFMRIHMLEKHGTIDKSDLDLFVITDHIDDALKIIKKSPSSEWWKMMD